MDISDSSWLLGPRGPIEYAEFMSMQGPVDVYLYPNDAMMVSHVKVFSNNIGTRTMTDMTSDHISLYGFRMSMMVQPIPRSIHVMDLAVANARIRASIMSRRGDR